ncbi:hypothetical protein [uncultured Caulobacter sp.]|uniref:hypothetical protein n=1 Tax=uncultured Caulobacter sp. TaxID=158749 RepID=UPI00261A2A19|nr:hypothetical protein [uncultured Caulobacter sp.]
MKRAIWGGLALALLAVGAARAETRMFSYDPISQDAKRLTGAGVTVLFKPGLLGGGRPLKVLATGVPAEARLKDGRARDLGPGGLKAMSGVDDDAALYEVDAKAAQGKIYLRAFCPGSTRLWLSFSTIAVRRDLRIQAFGDDPSAEGRARLCGTLDFSYRGEWRLPGRDAPDPMEDWTANPQHPEISN